MSVFIETSMLATIVFDEIDAGIGGATALAVSERLARLAEHSQVVCVTHLAQIAAHGARHIRVDKAVRKGHTAVGLADLQGVDERVTEIARMLSGEKSTVAREHAAALLVRFDEGK
jgi:DNA repair protein RecN (Recombination protein N)